MKTFTVFVWWADEQQLSTYDRKAKTIENAYNNAVNEYDQSGGLVLCAFPKMDVSEMYSPY